MYSGLMNVTRKATTTSIAALSQNPRKRNASGIPKASRAMAAKDTRGQVK
jgi:hypothetical protein